MIELLNDLGEIPDHHMHVGPYDAASHGSGLSRLTFLLSDCMASLTSWHEIPEDVLLISAVFIALNAPLPEKVKSFAPRHLFLWQPMTIDCLFGLNCLPPPPWSARMEFLTFLNLDQRTLDLLTRSCVASLTERLAASRELTDNVLARFPEIESRDW